MDQDIVEPNGRVFFSNDWYNRLKWVAQVVLPALALFYITLAPLWGLPKPNEVSATVVATDLLLGTLLGLSNRQYQNSNARFDGAILVDSNEAEGYTNLNVQLDPKAIANKDEVTVKVKRV